MKPVAIGITFFAGLLLLSCPALTRPAVAAERPTNPAQLLLWFLSLNGPRDQQDRQKVDVNSATAEALTAVPGLDRRQALKIIAYRPYASLQDLVRAGLSARFIERLAGLLTVDSRVAEDATETKPPTPVR
jgi:DNA uptake protein ComE-like DNA-binding protein